METTDEGQREQRFREQLVSLWSKDRDWNALPETQRQQAIEDVVEVWRQLGEKAKLKERMKDESHGHEGT